MHKMSARQAIERAQKVIDAAVSGASKLACDHGCPYEYALDITMVVWPSAPVPPPVGNAQFIDVIAIRENPHLYSSTDYAGPPAGPLPLSSDPTRSA